MQGAEHSLDSIRKKDRRVREAGERCDVLLPVQLFGVSVVGLLKDWRDVNQRKKAKSHIPSPDHVENKEEHLQAKNNRDGFWFSVGLGKKPCPDVHSTFMSSKSFLICKVRT